MAIRRFQDDAALPPDVRAFKKRLFHCTRWEKTTCGVTFYLLHGQHCLRSQSSLTRERVLRSKQFERTRHHAQLLKEAASLVSPLYRALTEDWRCREVYRKMVGAAIQLLKKGITGDRLVQGIQAALYQLGYRTEWPTPAGLPANLQKWKEEEKAKTGQPLTIRSRRTALVIRRQHEPPFYYSADWVLLYEWPTSSRAREPGLMIRARSCP